MILALASISILFSLAWLPSSLAKKKTFGTQWLLTNRDRQPGELPAWGQRAERAYNNLKDNFPAFAIGCLVCLHLGLTGSLPSFLAWVFVVARICHFGVYVAGIVSLRALSWMLGLAATLGLWALVLQQVLGV
jgi:uncharacterized MAPEG superfamily protein